MELLGLTQITHLWVFFAMVAGIIILPGMDMAYVMASALVGGRKAGWAAVAGIVVGGMVHVLMGVIGVGVVIKTMPQVFNAMLLLGSVYIAWIGWSLLSGASALDDVREGTVQPWLATFSKAAATCLLNPKAYVFMLAVFPQFLRLEYGPIATQAVLLSLITALTQVVVYGAIAMGAAHIRVWLRTNQQGQVRLGQGVGVLLVLASLWTGWQGWRLI
jgi:threonine/homoserine/homoserine lactone efflux protein